MVHKSCHLKKAIEKIKPYTHSRHARHMVLWAEKAYEGKRQAAGAPEMPPQQKGLTKHSSHMWLLGFKLNTIKNTAALVSSHISNAHSHMSYINYGMCLPLHRVLHNRDVPEWSGKALLGGYLLSCKKRPKGNQGSEDSIFKELPAGRHRKHKFTMPGHRGKVTRAETKPKHTGPVGWASGQESCGPSARGWPGGCALDSDQRTQGCCWGPAEGPLRSPKARGRLCLRGLLSCGDGEHLLDFWIILKESLKRFAVDDIWGHGMSPAERTRSHLLSCRKAL